MLHAATTAISNPMPIKSVINVRLNHLFLKSEILILD
jgi:hypothetical protein